MPRNKAVPDDVAERRALTILDIRNGVPARVVADAVWPGHTMSPAGAGSSAAHVLRRLQKRGLAYMGPGALWLRAGRPA